MSAENRAGKGFSLKDQLFNEGKVRYFAGLFKAADAGFDADAFVAQVMETMLSLELMDRLRLIAKVLEDHLPSDFPSAAKRLHAMLPPPLDPMLTDDDFGDFIHAPLGAYVAANGMDHVEISLDLLREMTKRFSVEFDIRYFLNAAPDETMKAITAWAQDDNYHVRRLASEGTRPVLPWGKKIGIDVTDPLPLLDILHSDKTRYVTRSVANHLNDITKKHPDLVVKTLKRWQDSGQQDPKELAWMTSHALRTLVKRGHKPALALLGYRDSPEITVSDLRFPDSVEIGDTAPLSFTITAQHDENLMIDYVIDFIKKTGATAPKVYKLKKLAVKRGETVQITKNHRFLKGATTFTHYPGAHHLYIQINGNKLADQGFNLYET